MKAKRIAYDKHEEDMPDWVAAFLRLIREDFFNLYATRALDCDNVAETERLNWGREQAKACSRDIFQWHCKFDLGS